MELVYKPGLAHKQLKTSEGHHSAADLKHFGFTVQTPNDFGHYNEDLYLPGQTVNTSK